MPNYFIYCEPSDSYYPLPSPPPPYAFLAFIGAHAVRKGFLTIFVNTVQPMLIACMELAATLGQHNRNSTLDVVTIIYV